MIRASWVMVPPRVLVAEDQPLLRWAIGRMLGPLGADVVFAHTYRQACDLLSSTEFAAVIVASPLEERSVVGLLREVDRMQPHTRLLVLCSPDSNERVQGDIPRATVFHKPFPLSELAAVIAPLLVTQTEAGQRVQA